MNNWVLKILLFISLLVSQLTPSLAQKGSGWKAGIGIQFGTHIQRIGVMYELYGFYDRIQVNQGGWIHFNFKNLGPKGGYPELKLHFGAQYQWLATARKKYLLTEFSNLSPYDNSVGYSFFWYLDKKEMSQTTGAIHFTASSILFALDNDALGLSQIDDKFRTGGFYIGYQMDSLMLGVQSTLWTGKSAGTEVIHDESYPSRFGYRDVSKTKYGENSHGILAFRVDYLWRYNQTFRVEAGIDSERVRHAIQNKLIHDGISRRLVTSRNPHYPMLSQDGSLFLFKEGQEIRKAKPYFQISSNQSLLY